MENLSSEKNLDDHKEAMENGGSSGGYWRPPCAACASHQRECPAQCLLAPIFPAVSEAKYIRCAESFAGEHNLINVIIFHRRLFRMKIQELGGWRFLAPNQARFYSSMSYFCFNGRFLRVSFLGIFTHHRVYSVFECIPMPAPPIPQEAFFTVNLS